MPDLNLPQLRLWDILDVIIVLYLFYIIYQLLKGNIAFNIFIGVMAIFGIWKLTGLLNMKLTSMLFEQFASVGIIMLLIVFQPEIRRFLLMLGNTTLRQQYRFFDRWFSKDKSQQLLDDNQRQKIIRNIKTSILNLSKEKNGALIVIAQNALIDNIISTGIELNATITHELIESIFNKKSPLHDGAIVISNNKIIAASCILPLTQKPDLPKKYGLRHRAAIGTSEQIDVMVFVVSEESGEISFSERGIIQQYISESNLNELLMEKYLS
ncbi:MAG: diadenylate cyclase CdaA [Bacteroidota bacterium]